MTSKLLQKIWRGLNTEIDLSATVTGGVEGGKAVFEIAKVIQKNATELSLLNPFIKNIDSFLDALNSPLGQVVKESLPFLPIATGIITYIIKKNEHELTLEDEVQLVAQAAYLESLRGFLIDHPEISEKLETEASEAVQKKIKEWDKEFNFNDRDAEETLICFYDSPLRKKFDEILIARLKESGLDENTAKDIAERISRSTHRHMKKAVLEVKDHATKLAAIYGGGWQQELEVYSSIDKYLEEAIAGKPKEPVFDENFSFQDIYVPLEVKPVDSYGKVEEAESPQNIEEWAKAILRNEDKDKQVLFLQAGPGRGKSVFCRMFADWVRRELHPIYTPILIRLRNIKIAANIDDTLANAVGSDFVKTDRGWLTDRNTRFLFLLDGFDELLLERGASNELKVFLEQVEQFQRQAAERKDRGHRVLITGRPLALYGIEGFLPLLNLERASILDMDYETQQEWFKKWQTVAGETEAEKFRKFLYSEQCPEQVKELAREPLLLYLLALMHRDEQLQLEMFATADVGEAKVLIYEQALEWVLKKQRVEDGKNINRKITKLEPRDLEILLAEAGLSVVQSGGEYAKIQMIEDRLLEQGYQDLKDLIEDARQNKREDGLKNPLAAFYLKKSETATENSVEFFHKSFGEFLCAKRMVESLEDLAEETRKQQKTYVVSDKELKWQVYDLFGYGRLTVEVVEYLMALLVKSEVKLEVLFKRLHGFYLDWCEGKFIEATGETLPQKKVLQLKEWGIESGQRQVDIYTGLNVMILLFLLHSYGQSQEELREQLHFYPYSQPGSENFDGTRLLRIIGYSQCIGNIAFVNIVGIFLRGANLIRAYLSGAYLRGANLSDAYLIGANLSGADLSSANLSSANLSGAYLSGANLSTANLSDAYLIRANLIRADLGGAYLIRADLSGAYLSGADLGAYLSGANLSGAYLGDANLRVADLSDANLSDADLSGANLSDADLSGANLNNIKWDNQTKWSNTIGLHEAREVPEDLRQNPAFATAFAHSEAASQQQE